MTIPYFTEPPAHERRPHFSAVPECVISAIEARLNGTIAKADAVTGGMLPAATFRIYLDDGRQFFAKGAQPGDVSHATQNIRQEARAYDFLAAGGSMLAPRFYGLAGDGDEDGWLLGLWDFIADARPADPAAAFSLLAQLQKTPCAPHDLPGVEAAPYLRGFFTPDKKWRRLESGPDRDAAPGLFADPPAALRWLEGGLPALLALQDKITRRLGQHGLMHGDARSEHFLTSPPGERVPGGRVPGGRVPGGRVIDWANASYGPLGFDVIFLTLDLSARSGQSFCDLLGVAAEQGVNIPGSDDLLSLLACFSGYFMTQAHRPVPDGLPRLRWMQKSILRSGLLALQELGVLAPVPQFLR